jgi:hypothetical protein
VFFFVNEERRVEEMERRKNAARTLRGLRQITSPPLMTTI